jgi:acetoin:2,6-dichlorophenolindophenol oxidoreductase subunit alpha
MTLPNEPVLADRSHNQTDVLELGLRIDLYKTMLLCRRFEERMLEEIRKNNVPGGLMQSTGQEAIGVGVGAALQQGDIVRHWVRGVSQAIGRKMPLDILCAEMMGKAMGGIGGRGGIQFATWKEGDFYGGGGVIGSVMSVAAGQAMAQKIRGEKAVTVCYFGEGAVQIGLAHEAFNLAGLWQLPIIFVCENNGYALSAPWKTQTAAPDVVCRAPVYGLRAAKVDGNDAEAVYREAMSAREHALEGRPTLIEATTYRLGMFSTGEVGTLGDYIPADVKEGWRQYDPLMRLRARLVEQGHMTPEDEARWESEISDTVDDAVQTALNSPEPDPSDLLKGLLE